MPAFPDIAKIAYKGPDSNSPLSFRHYAAANQSGRQELFENVMNRYVF